MDTCDQRPKMADIIPEGSLGQATVKHCTISGMDAAFANIRSRGPFDRVRPGRFAQLLISGRLYMSDTEGEWLSNGTFRRRANGHVLVAGLGLGFNLLPVLSKPNVVSVTVLENSADVIGLIEPPVRRAANGTATKLSVIHADAFTWKPVGGWDTIYFDIWPDITTDALREIAALKRHYAKRLRRDTPGAWMGAWYEDQLRRLRRQGE